MRNNIRLAAAQTVDKNDFQSNLIQHCKFIEAAGREGVELLVLPELSLTGYHQEQGESRAIDLSDRRLDPLREASTRTKVTVIAGFPIRVNDKLFIASAIFTPDKQVKSYYKQYLHPGEERFYDAGSDGPAYLDEMAVALAICADTSHPEHTMAASALGATVYAASSLITPGGYAQDSGLLKAYAVNHQFAVLLANHGGATGGFDAAGKSAIWDEQGQCVVQASGTGEQLVIGECVSGYWTGRVIPMEITAC